MTKAIDKMIADILKVEGGYVDDPDDRGGATKHGISLRYAKSIGLDLDGDGDTDSDDIKLVDRVKAAQLYKDDFYFGPKINRLPNKIRAQMFDMAVNLGGARSIMILQETLNDGGATPELREDGIMGGKTLKAVSRYPKSSCLNDDLVTARIKWYIRLARRRPTQKKFIRGWILRAEKFRS